MAAVQKKFVVKPFPAKKVMDVQEARKTFEILENGINQIYEKRESQLSFEEHYRYGYNLVLNKHGDLLYNGLSNLFRNHLVGVIIDLVETPTDVLLQNLSRVWTDHKMIYAAVKDVMMYVDRNYVVQHRKPSVYTNAVLIFRNEVFYNPGIRDRVREILLNNIDQERKGCLIDRALMKETLCMLGDFSMDGVNVYEEDFERSFLASTRSYYNQEAQELLQMNNCPEYLQKAETRLGEEILRVRHYLSASTEPKLRGVIEYEYITANAKLLVEMEGTGAVALMISDRIVELKKLYGLFCIVQPTLEYLRDALGNYINRRGTEIVADPESAQDPLLFVQRMIDHKTKFDRIIKEAFQDEKKFYKKLKDAFEDFVNKDTRTASFLASYVDDLLKSSSKSLTESEIEIRVDQVMTIFKFLSDKDIFEHMYRAHFSKRLMGNKSVSEDLERLLIARLKSECGQQFTSKLEGMFLDMQLAKEVMDGFRASPLYPSGNAPGSFELDVLTLTQSHWAMKPSAGCPPAQVASACEAFKEYYGGRFNTGRRLFWMMSAGHADIKANFACGRRELNVSTYQMCILLMFNETETLTLDQIRRGLQGVAESELRRHLLSLCTPKLRILRKSSTSKGIEDDDVFTFNHEFNSKFKRIKVPLISARESALEETEAASSAVEEDRRHEAEAAIVRIMKARRTLSHADLLAEATRQLGQRFAPTPMFVKKRIESLIEREYLQRDREDARMYRYLA